MNGNSDAFLKGMVSGFTTSLDASPYGMSTDVADAATRVASNEQEASGQGEGTDYITGQNSGVRYGQLKNDRATQLMTMLAHTANNFIDTGDIGAALNVGSQAVQAHNNMAWRAQQAGQLDDQGFDPVGIQAWIQSGDSKDLATGAGQQIVNINGKNVRMSNQDALAYQRQQQAEQTNTHRVVGGQDITYDARGNEVSRSNVSPTVEQANAPLKTEDLGDRVVEYHADGSRTYSSKGQTPDNQAKQSAQGTNASYNPKLGTFGYYTQLPSGERAFVHTNSRNQEQKSGSNLIYDVVDDDGNRIRTETGQINAQGSTGKFTSVYEASDSALDGLKQTADLGYSSGGTVWGNTINRAGNFFTGNADQLQNVESQTRKSMQSLLYDQALAASAPRALLKGDGDVQSARSGIISPNKKPEENQRTLDTRVKAIAYAQVIAEYADSHGGRYPSVQESQRLKNQRVEEIYRDNPQLSNAFGQKTPAKREAPNSTNTATLNESRSGGNTQGSASTGKDLGSASAPEGTTHTNSAGITATVVNGRWIQQ